MGILEHLQGKRIYLDSNIWIYSIENYPEYSAVITVLFQHLEQGSFEIFTSELTLAETLVKPIKDGNLELQQIYESAIVSRKPLSVMPVERSILVQAADIRAQSKIKLPDAIHAATALSTQCTTFLTNDKQLRAIPDITVLLLSQLNAESP